ncbi:MAG: protein TolR [Desulfobacterales bacterium]
MSDINVTPFVDVMLVLLIIFMVTAPMMTQGVDVALPEATAEPLPADTEHLMISIDNKGVVFINDVTVTVDDLGEKLKRIMSTRSDRGVYLKADKDIAYGTVVRVMSEIKLAGVEKLGMVTVPLPENEKVKKK